MVPDLKGWRMFRDGLAIGGSPPWIVVGLNPDSTLRGEALNATACSGSLDIRVVGESQLGIGIACEKLQQALDGAYPGSGFSRLIPDKDSGIFASELESQSTSRPFMMRVLTWRVSWEV